MFSSFFVTSEKLSISDNNFTRYFIFCQYFIYKNFEIEGLVCVSQCFYVLCMEDDFFFIFFILLFILSFSFEQI
ncbi:hypothetical protein A2U10_05110 [Fusobacterium necrophorum subsp. funduliforme]|nr:hypothetical protein C4N15_01620 [Fusobacterium necrophorum subsp. funduliforme]AYV96190.1 hypothetical protein BWX37_11450 [Fusobacterium necrophorum subsp. funduliforme]KYM39399.1 hypothetical protein A2U10_05110 [Fusobacterium necrophorum subsp. funduliforme]KYM50515.1 hypothetical protein A2U11_09400 [Fusobacterium necrophorum subsp. funduliforme]KYM57220.1 hypothetical protein A2U07_09750 [Fusobacterium necrophorum subsp. funduliforme]